jgi:bifunctional non-homologous end joining protein LigD
MELQLGDRTIACTNVDRVMFPDSGITKKEMLEYYRDVADVMIPHLRGRGLTIERCTKGVDRGGFFQKHFQKHYPAWLDRMEMGTKTKVAYPVCDDAAGLVYLANQGGVAFHVGTSRKDRPDRPDQIVFDLDPPDGRFDLARRAAAAVRALMDQLELATFVKTTGSKGLHVFVPTDGTATQEDVAAFCKHASAKLAHQHADLLTTEFYKKDRKGRLYLDTMRNAVAATVVSAWSLRGKPGAPVSAPLAWDEVDDPALTADAFNLRNIRARLDERGDPWSELHESGGSIANALAELDWKP